jgi:CubicO group peptidase (beta-lactamase class C family)
MRRTSFGSFMPMARTMTVALALALLVRGPLRAAPAPVPAPAPLEGFDDYVRTAVADWEAPGLAIAVVKDGELVFSRGYGFREIGKPEPVDDRTLFAIGSTTKAMTAAALGMLVDEKKLSWDDPVTKHLPWFQLHDPVLTREVTIRDLLTHRAGLPNADFLWYGQGSLPHDILLRMRYLPSETSPRSHFTYQNVMYAAAGAVVAEVSGMAWEDFVRTRIFEPLHMDGTLPTAAALARQANVASPHFRIDGEVRAIENASVDPIAPAGAVWSSVSDMAKWMRFLLEGTTPEGKPLLARETLEEIFRPQTLVDGDEFYPTQKLTHPHWMTYGFGWFQEDYEGRRVDFHTGSIDGMVAIHGLVRDERLGVYVLANLDHAELRHALMYRVFDLYRGGPGRDWNREILDLYRSLEKEADEREARIEKERVPNTKPSLPLDSYAGTYRDPLGGTVAVTRAGDGLRLSYGPGLEGRLEHWNYDFFRVAWDKVWRGHAFVSFGLDRKGEVATLALDGLAFHRAGNENGK